MDSRVQLESLKIVSLYGVQNGKVEANVSRLCNHSKKILDN